MKTISGGAMFNVGQMGLVASAVVYMFTTFVSASDFNSYIVEDFYDKYYMAEELLIVESDDAARRRIERTMERLRTKICEIEPEWEQCRVDPNP